MEPPNNPHGSNGFILGGGGFHFLDPLGGLGSSNPVTAGVSAAGVCWSCAAGAGAVASRAKDA